MTPTELPRLWTGEAVVEHALEVAGIPVTGPLREEIRKRGGRGGLLDTLAALPLAVRDPVRARLEDRHQEAHEQLDRLAARDLAKLTARRAKNRLRKLRGLMAFLKRTDHHRGDGVPGADERARLLGPVIAELEKLARRPAPARRRDLTPIPPTPKEIPMSDARTTGRVIDEPPEETARRAEADAARANGHGAGLPEGLIPYLAHFDMKFKAPSAQPRPVLEAEADRLARAVVTFPNNMQITILTNIFFRLGMRSTR